MYQYMFSGSFVSMRVVLFVALIGSSGYAQTISFRKVADTNTPIPGGVGNFTGFTSSPVIDRGDVAFVGRTASPSFIGIYDGVYTDIGGTLRPVATRNTVGLGGVGKFSRVNLPSIDAGLVAFYGKVRLQDGSPVASGVYLENSGTITEVAVTGTPAPNGGVFNFFGTTATSRPSLSMGNVAFTARTNDVGYGVFLYSGGTLSTVADQNTVMPGQPGTFDVVDWPFLSGDNVVYRGIVFSSNDGIYSRIGGVTNVIADTTMTIPGSAATFAKLRSPIIDGEDIVFTDLGSNLQTPIAPRRSYTYFDGVLAANSIGSGLINSPSLENRVQVGTVGSGVINTNMGGSIFRVIGSGDVLEGKTVSLAYQSHESLSGNEIVFYAGFEEGSSGIYVASIQLSCGDQVVDAGEDCDDGSESATCDFDCTFPVCGDDVLNTLAGEFCDDGVNNSDTIADACRTNCQLPACGDGVIDTGEECDDAGASAMCLADCTISVCGDGIINSLAGEVCDDGANNSDTVADACRLDCQPASCGDGTIDTGEVCDDGTLNSDTAADACRLDCSLPRCGDGTIDSAEDCDDAGQSASCDTDCTIAECGDATINALAGEQCDDGFNNSDTTPNACRNDCLPARCGDGVVDMMEVCDDGNTDDGDFCPADCSEDGFVIPAVSDWGLVILALLLCVVARLHLGFRTEQ